MNRNTKIALWSVAAVLVVMFVAGSQVVAIEIHVPDHYATIQEAIDSASDGDEVVVSPGIYSESVDFKSKSITLRSTNVPDWNVIPETIIDGEGQVEGVALSDAGQLLGLTIRNFNRFAIGGGVHGGGGQARIAYNIIRDNHAVSGGGIGVSSARIEYNVITGNTALGDQNLSYTGGGLDMCHGQIIGNMIIGNSALSGGGLWGCLNVIENNVIAGNIGGGLRDCAFGRIQNNTIINNTVYGLSGCWDSDIVNNIIWGNDSQILESSVPSFSCIEGFTTGGIGNLGADPLLVGSGFRLGPRSPCIDAGTSESAPTIDQNGNPRPVDGDGDGRAAWDIGAYEYVRPTLARQWARYR